MIIMFFIVYPFFQSRAEAIATYALCGFSNISSIGIQLGGMGAMAPERKSDLAEVGVRALIAGSAACFLTACVAGKPSTQLKPLSSLRQGRVDQSLSSKPLFPELLSHLAHTSHPIISVRNTCSHVSLVQPLLGLSSTRVPWDCPGQVLQSPPNHLTMTAKKGMRSHWTYAFISSYCHWWTFSIKRFKDIWASPLNLKCLIPKKNCE